jgi:hypothetical protein
MQYLLHIEIEGLLAVVFTDPLDLEDRIKVGDLNKINIDRCVRNYYLELYHIFGDLLHPDYLTI